MKAIKQTYTRAELEQAERKARRDGSRDLASMILRIVAIALFDKAGADKEQVKNVLDMIHDYCELFINEGVTLAELDETLRQEYDFRMVG